MRLFTEGNWSVCYNLYRHSVTAYESADMYKTLWNTRKEELEYDLKIYLKLFFFCFTN